MIELRQASKYYGSLEALHDVSFIAPDKRIMGLLGVNGAGKTTALNLMTGYFPPTNGNVFVDGMDMQLEPIACKRRIGYLPERPPLYDEMSVSDYLAFVSRLREVKNSSIKKHVEEIIELCGLQEVCARVIGHLSKGYRQRVGVAQALCGNPGTLVLDEPTSGLDPRQAVEMRQMMRQLAKEHSIVFSSHVLPEIQQLCDRVVILNHGRVVRSADMRELTCDENVIRLRVSIAASADKVIPAIRGLPCVRRVKQRTSSDEITEAVLTCDTDGAGRGDPRIQIFRLMAGMDMPILTMTQDRDTLEDVFLRITSGEQEEKTGEV